MTLMRRRGSVLAMAIVMMGIMLALVLGTLAYFESANRKSRQDRWAAVASDAADSGLGMMRAWARTYIDKFRTTPPEWDVPDGTVSNPLLSLYDSKDFTDQLPGGATSAPHFLPNIGDLAAPAKPGDVIEKDGAGEFVVGRYGNFIASFKVRLQPFKLSDGVSRQYKIGVAGRVRMFGRGGDTSGPFSGTRIVADRVLLASIGKVPLSRFAALVDIDLVRNWVPGEVIEGPVHINRGYVDYTGPAQPAGMTAENGRSGLSLQAPGQFAAVGVGNDFPVFNDTFSMTFKTDGLFPDAANFSNFAKISDTSVKDQPIVGDPPFTEELARKIFQAPDNQAKLGTRAAPIFQKDPIMLPPNSRGRLTTALDVPPGVDLALLPWFSALPDGVHVPTVDMVGGVSGDYSGPFPGGAVAGGIYVRGNVEVMRMAVKGDKSYYMFQLGYGHPASQRRCYTVVANRMDRSMRLIAYTPGQTLREVIAAKGLSLATLEGGGPTSSDPTAFGIAGAGEQIHDFPARVPADPSASPFNGLIFVDYSRFDPVRKVEGGLATWLPGPGPLGNDVTPLTGHILALGDPGNPAGAGDPADKQEFVDASKIVGFERAEVVSTEDVLAPISSPPHCTKLNIIAAGNIFIQNHVLVDSVINTIALDPNLNSLRKQDVRLSATRDLLGLVADKQIVIGLSAPSTNVRTNLGLVVTAAIAALGDPAFIYKDGATEPVPVPGPPAAGAAYNRFAYRGSFASESLVQLFGPGQIENYDIISQAAAPSYPLVGVYAPAANYPYNPLYDNSNGANWGFANLAQALKNPNALGTRGKLIVFGSIVSRKRGVVGVGNLSYDKDYRYDQRLLSIAPPLFPNSLNLVTYFSRVNSAGFPPYLTGPQAEELKFLN